MKIKVEHMRSKNSNREIVNQFVIYTGSAVYFQSYKTIIAKIENGKTTLDQDRWNYSKTTSKYRNIFLGLDTEETKRRIKAGEIKLKNLNQ
ncbi:hypothetical protein EOM82_09680 [bacterium]|nr:hypothetical protein [bacterium]